MIASVVISINVFLASVKFITINSPAGKLVEVVVDIVGGINRTACDSPRRIVACNSSACDVALINEIAQRVILVLPVSTRRKRLSPGHAIKGVVGVGVGFGDVISKFSNYILRENIPVGVIGVVVNGIVTAVGVGILDLAKLARGIVAALLTFAVGQDEGLEQTGRIIGVGSGIAFGIGITN